MFSKDYQRRRLFWPKWYELFFLFQQIFELFTGLLEKEHVNFLLLHCSKGLPYFLLLIQEWFGEKSLFELFILLRIELRRFTQIFFIVQIVNKSSITVHIEILGIFYLVSSRFYLPSGFGFLELLLPSFPKLFFIEEFVLLNPCLLPIDDSISLFLEFLVDLAQAPLKCLWIEVLIRFLKQLSETLAHLLLLKIGLLGIEFKGGVENSRIINSCNHEFLMTWYNTHIWQ